MQLHHDYLWLSKKIKSPGLSWCGLGKRLTSGFPRTALLFANTTVFYIMIYESRLFSINLYTYNDSSILVLPRLSLKHLGKLLWKYPYSGQELLGLTAQVLAGNFSKYFKTAILLNSYKQLLLLKSKWIIVIIRAGKGVEKILLQHFACYSNITTYQTYFRPIFPFYTLWKHQRFSDVFVGYRNGRLSWNWLITLETTVLTFWFFV